MAPVDNSLPTDAENRYTFNYDVDDERELGTTVTNAVASVTDSSPEEAAESLVRTVDPDGLDRLFCARQDPSNDTGGRLVLSMDGCFVTVSSDGRVVVET